MGILSHYFSPSDLSDIKEAVKEAESKTSGEIVPFFAEASHHYKEWIWLGSFLGGAIGGLALFVVDKGHFSSWTLDSIDAITFVWSGALLGMVLPFFISKLRLFLVPYNSKAFFVNLKAKEAFLDEEVFRTNNRTGILIYISLYERIVRILPDSGIASIVPKSDWDEAVNLIVHGMKTGKKKEGIVASILFCGNLLVKYGVKIQKDDKNEISDEIRDGGTHL